ncbi:biotin-dependent carboxyltransferase family protein [Rhodobacteraceae bacterium N5(2021)]|uniref:Biotin-dependent carboxyltransferase family protein n=1 Tax=Gymnodinialimonas phycosphaerae TaxID=2841589 RepID=A0A975TYA9_9RHOB|nr:biotin-dependent carboxyltransferase family protein [Gymnodinialimonas phycosphaerae]MBY4892666.1 biotin-dependent carboxyltransferase family protein [Gymnodinialimonas phycosphaerae]
MSTARFKVSFAGPLVSLQDAGRTNQMRFGVPASGPMDRFGFAAAHAMLGQAAATAIEVSLGGLVLECVDGAVTCAVAGGAFSLNAQAPGWQALTVAKGDRLTLRAGTWGSWCYLAFAGSIATEQWLGSSATHTLSGLGGGTLRAGDTIEIHDAAVRPGREGPYACPDIARPVSDICVILGPQDHHFAPDAVHTLTASPYRMTDAFDRMGVRLDGPALSLGDALSIPSEPILRGSIQVAGDGVPVVLLADHQTTGGYPKIATLLSSDTDRLAQLRAGDTFRFRAVTAAEAVALTRRDHDGRAAALAALSAPRATLEHLLSQSNLISGVTSD